MSSPQDLKNIEKLTFQSLKTLGGRILLPKETQWRSTSCLFIFLFLFCYVPLSHVLLGSAGRLDCYRSFQGCRKGWHHREVLYTRHDFTVLQQRRGRVVVWTENPSLELTFREPLSKTQDTFWEVMSPWRFWGYLVRERLIRRDDSTYSR